MLNYARNYARFSRMTATIMKASGKFRFANVSCRIPPKRTSTALGTVMGLMILSLGAVSHAQNNLVTPAQYLLLQMPPNFAPDNPLPHLTRWGWTLSTNTDMVLATNWDYDLEFSGCASTGNVQSIFTPGSYNSVVTYLASNQPSLFKLSVIVDRSLPPIVPNSAFCTNSSGLFVDNVGNSWATNTIIYSAAGDSVENSLGSGNFPTNDAVTSPQAPSSYLVSRAAYQMQSLAVIQSNAPLDIVMDGGEYDMQVPGWGESAWLQDPRVQAATRGMTIYDYSSQQKSYQLSYLYNDIKQQVPNRGLYIFYEAGNAEQTRVSSAGQGYLQWGWSDKNMASNVDLLGCDFYYNGRANWTNNSKYSGGNAYYCDYLTKTLNVVGFNIKFGYPLTYDWLSGGSTTTDTNAYSDMATYTGFLKCLYTAGMVGAVAEQDFYPPGTNGPLIGGPGFDASFPTNQPPDWLQQMMALSHVHALFSHLTSFLYNGSLMPGVTSNIMSTDQPAYEFTNTVADPYSRVLARKLNGRNQWIVTAWNSNEKTNTVTVNIPTIGNLNVTAVPSGSVYQVTMTGTNVQRILLDEYTSLPPPPPSNFRLVTR